MVYEHLSSPAKRRLNDMHWCRCGHGQPAHTRNAGKCHGGTRAGEGLCRCLVFVEKPREPEPDQ